LNRLNYIFADFNNIRDVCANKLNSTLTLLERYNEEYLCNPPKCDDDKIRYRQLQYNLTQRNDGIASLLQAIKKVSDKRSQIELCISDIAEVTEFCQKECAGLDYVLTE
jgi:hypothetical protein